MNSTGDLHSNWRALATIHLPFKRFVHAKEEHDRSSGNSHGQTLPIENVDGEEMKLFYEGIIHDNNTHQPAAKMEASSIERSYKNSSVLKPFNKVKFFRCAMEDDKNGLQDFLYKDDEINTCDDFGWTALMMAACAGAVNAVKMLLQLGANMEIQDMVGRTALKLAEVKGHTKIVKLLDNKTLINADQMAFRNQKQISDCDKLATKPFFCDICRRDFKESRYQQHLTSTVHQFNARSTINKLQNFNIASRNRGLKIMLKQGWDKESGLGPSNSGRLYPVKTVIRKQRTGLGIKQSPARVTHFNAYKSRATDSTYSEYSKKKSRNRNDVRFEKQHEWRMERRLRRELS